MFLEICQFGQTFIRHGEMNTSHVTLLAVNTNVCSHLGNKMYIKSSSQEENNTGPRTKMDVRVRKPYFFWVLFDMVN